MIVSEDLLDQATAAESLKPLFDEKPDDMTDEQWFEMRLARDDAEMEGIQHLNEVRAKMRSGWPPLALRNFARFRRKQGDSRGGSQAGRDRCEFAP